jgi:hypothetical protein
MSGTSGDHHTNPSKLENFLTWSTVSITITSEELKAFRSLSSHHNVLSKRIFKSYMEER